MTDLTQMHRDTDQRDLILFLTGYLSFRALCGRRDDLGLPLRPDENARLAELETIFGGRHDDEADERAAFVLRLEERARLQLSVEFRRATGELAEGRLSNLSASGFFVETAYPLRSGEQTILKFLDADAGREWQFAGEVVWSRRGDSSGMGLRFVGIPLEVRIGHRGGGLEAPLPAAA